MHLQIQNLTRRYGEHTVLNQLSLEVTCRVFGIAGSNGSGKSTLLKCISGLLKPSKGRIIWTIDNHTLLPPQLCGRIGYAAPYVELYEGMNVSENLKFLRQLRSKDSTGRERQIPELLDYFQASPFADKLYGELSTGQRQRVKLAAACIHDPPLLCLDEPGSNLDEEGRELIRQTVSAFAEQLRMVIIASNQPEELDICSEILDLDEYASRNSRARQPKRI